MSARHTTPVAARPIPAGLCALILALLAATTAWAADPAPAAGSPGEMQALVARLSDEEVRALLIQRLDGTGPAAPAAAPTRPTLQLPSVDEAVDLIVATGVRVAQTARATPATLATAGTAMAARLGEMDAPRLWRLAAALIASAGLAGFALRLARPGVAALRAVAALAAAYVAAMVGVSVIASPTSSRSAAFSAPGWSSRPAAGRDGAGRLLCAGRARPAPGQCR